MASSPKPNNPSLWSRAKAEAKKKFKVYPSAYANAWASKCISPRVAHGQVKTTE